MPNNPIIRYVPTDKYDANNQHKYHPESEIHLYYVFLYKNKKPMYKLRCIYKNLLMDSIKDLLSSDPELEYIVPIMTTKISSKKWIEENENVMVDLMEE